MAKSMILLEKIKPKSGLQRRRNSTGGAATIFSHPNPIPNYLRASIGSCHDLCKYGIRRDSPPEEESGSTEQQRRNRNMKPQPKYKGKKVPETKYLLLSSSRLKQPKETSKSTCNARASRNDEVKRRSSPPRTTSPLLPESSAKIPASKTRRSKSVPNKAPKSESKKLLESYKITQCETVAERIIHAVEANDGNQNEDLHSNLDQKQEMDSAANNLSPELEREEVVERENKEEDGWKERRLRRVVSEGDFDHKPKECMRLVVMSKSKVKALVDTFETLISATIMMAREHVRVQHKYTRIVLEFN